MSDLTNLWRWEPTTGYWKLMRDCYKDRAQAWLKIYQGDEPGRVFKLSKRRPIKAPKE